MKAKQVLKLLKITRPTLCSYVRDNKIKAIKLPNGYYDYDENSVYQFFGQPNPDSIKINVIYARVSTYKQKNDLGNQVIQLIEYCNSNNIKYDKIFQEIASGIDFDRSQFSELIKLVMANRVNNIYVTYKDRISRLSFITLQNLFKHFGTNIIVINSSINSSDNDDLFEELMNIIHLFSTKLYSHRRKNKKSNKSI